MWCTNIMASSSVVTRSGRRVKKPQLFEPVEDVVDDWGVDDHDSDIDSDIDTENEYHSEDEDESEDDEDEDADENGNLKGFVVVDSESEDA